MAWSVDFLDAASVSFRSTGRFLPNSHGIARNDNVYAIQASCSSKDVLGGRYIEHRQIVPLTDFSGVGESPKHLQLLFKPGGKRRQSVAGPEIDAGT